MASALKRLRPDVAALQEVPRLVAPGLSARLLAGAAGMRVACAGRPARGNALLVGPDAVVTGCRIQSLPHEPGLHHRAACHATGEHSLAAIHLVAVHLSLRTDQRLQHLRLVLEAIPPGAAVVMGDLNEPADGPTWRMLADAGFVDATPAGPPTFPSRGTRIDGVLVRGLVARAVEIGPAWDTLSDHHPVAVDLIAPRPAYR